MFAKIAYKLTDFWLSRFTKIKVIGPIDFDSSDYRRLTEFRTFQNQLRAPYLEEKHQVGIENKLQIDERSLHFALEKNGAIVVCVRLTPLPFEFSALSEEFGKRAEAFQGYLEFGRLCTDQRLERKGFHAGILVVKAAQHIFIKEKAKGVVGICKADRVPYMQKLGLQIDREAISIPERNSNYHVIHASKNELVQFYLKRFLKFLIFKKETQSSLLEKSNDTRKIEKQSRNRICETSQ